MFFTQKTAEQKRKELKKKLESSKCLRFVGAFSPLVAGLVEEKGFDGVYISGGMVAADKGWPDIGLTTWTEVLGRGEEISRFSALPSLLDADTGFGEGSNCARTIAEAEKRGLSSLHIEDQEFPKRCGHLDHKKLISTENMVLKIRSMVQARKDKNFLIIARTDAKGVLGMSEAIERAQAYQEAGADIIFPEALHTAKEFKEFRSQIKVPLLANMTEFGKTEITSYKAFQDMGYNIVLYPFTTWRLAFQAVEQGLERLYQDKQKDMLPQMQTRKRLYELLKYEDYKQWDKDIFNFKIDKDKT